MPKKIAYITDTHLDQQKPTDLGVDTRKNWETILKDVSSRGITEIVFGGDIGEEDSYTWFFESLQGSKLDITLGNHDKFSDVVKHYNFKHLGEHSALYYSKEDQDFKYIFLDSSTWLISAEQFDWFKKEILTDKAILLFVHHPMLAIDAEVDRLYALKDRNNIKAELLKLENDITIFCGHYHLDDESKEGNIRQFITPASSYQVEKLSNEMKVNNYSFGYRIIELNRTEVNTELILF